MGVGMHFFYLLQVCYVGLLWFAWGTQNLQGCAVGCIEKGKQTHKDTCMHCVVLVGDDI